MLARHGFADLSQQLGLGTLIDKGRAIVGASPKHAHDHERTTEERIRRVLEELGPTFVKLGQVMSTRPDLVPESWATEFKKLQSNVPPVEWEEINKQLLEEFPDGELRRVFRTIEHKPLAAGSMAQVHRAKLRDGTHIVIKVLRPGITDVLTVDMEILHSLAELAEKHFADQGYSPTEVVAEFAKELKREVDLMYEGRSTERLGALFADDPGVVFPKVYWEGTTHRVLAMEEIEGLVLSSLTDEKEEHGEKGHGTGKAAKHKQLTAKERRAIVENGARAVFKQCLEFGFFHADPHPGNIVALPKGKIAFIDCGMTGQVDARTARQLADLVTAVVSGDLDRVITVAGQIADAEESKLHDRALRADVQAIISEFQGTPLDRLNLGRVLQDFFSALRNHQVRCPADIILLIKALTTIESVARDVDPSFELVAFVRPYIDDLIARRYGVSALKSRFERSLVQYLELMEDIPGEVRPIFAQIRKNQLSVNLEHKGLDRLTRTVEHSSRNISFAVLIAAMLVGSAILILASRTPGLSGFATVGTGGLIGAGVITILHVIANRKYKRGG